MDSRPILITGGTGFIGSHLITRLISEGERPHVLVRPESSLTRIRTGSDRLTLWKGDLTRPDTVRECLERVGPGLIYHLAGDSEVRRMSPDLAQLDLSVEVNLRGTLNLLQAAHAMKTPPTSLIRLGGLEEYGNGSLPYDEAQREDPVSPYSASQVATTHYCQMLQKHVGFEILTLRPALVYGPGQSLRFLIPSLISHALEGKDFELSSETNGRDLIYIDDVVEGLILAAARPGLGGEVINLGSGREVENGHLARSILRLMNAKIKLKPNPSDGPSRETRHQRSKNAKAARLLQWEVRVGLEAGLTRTIEWFQANQGRWIP